MYYPYESDTIQYGDIIFTDRGPYSHFGIYGCDQWVVHYYSSISGSSERDAGIIEVTTLRNFRDGGKVKSIKFYEKDIDISDIRINFPTGLPKLAGYIFAKIHSPVNTIKKAESRLGEKDYSLVFNNCEHFAFWCKTGKSYSSQIDCFIGDGGGYYS